MDQKTYDELIVPYMGAIKIVRTLFENVQNELLRSPIIRNPIDSVHDRIKSLNSINEKCIRKCIDPNDLEAIKNTILDIAGVRVICLYKDDLQKIKEYVDHATGIYIREVKDYVSHPKPNGYQSLHLATLVEVPSVITGTMKIPVEIQVRTLAMQGWSQAEHRSRYKAVSPNPDSEELLRKASELAEQLDELYVQIRTNDGEI